MHVKITPKELFFSVSPLSIANTIECNNNASQKGVSTVYIIRGQFVGVNKPTR